MADAKLSEFPVASGLLATDLVPVVRPGINFVATFGQIKSFSNAITNIAVANNSAVSLSAEITKISGTCTIPNATVEGTKIVLVAISSGTLTGTGITFDYTEDFTLTLVWLNSKWFVLSKF